MSEKAGQVSLLGGNWTSTLVDGAHFFAVLGFLQQSPMKLPLKCSPWHRSCRSPRKARCSGAHLGRAPARDPGPSFPPAPQSRPCRDPTGGSAHMASPCGPGAVSARGQSQRWGRVAHPTLQELRAPTAWAPGRCVSERRRCSDYLPIRNVSTDPCSRGRRERTWAGCRARCWVSGARAAPAVSCVPSCAWTVRVSTGTRPRKTGMASSLWNLDSGYMSVRQICLSTFLCLEVFIIRCWRTSI